MSSGKSGNALALGAAAAGGAVVGFLVSKVLDRLRKPKAAATTGAPSKYKLTYFNARGRGEVSRLLFNVAGVAFEDARYPIDPATFKRAEFEADKNKFPFGQLPVLVVDDNVVIPQSAAIERLLARRFGLYGDTDIESAFIDAFYEQYRDIKDKYQTDKKANETKKFFTETLPKQFAMLEKCAASWGKGEWLVGSRMSYADIAFFNLCAYWDDQESVTASLADCPRLRAIRARVAQNEDVAHWVENRPKTAL